MINWMIEEIYKLYEKPSNLAEFEEWKKTKVSKVRSNCNEHTIEFQKKCEKLG